MKIIFKEISPTLITIFLIFSCLGIFTAFPKAPIDYPCFARYDEVNKCVEIGDGSNRNDDKINLRAYLNATYVGFGGMGCGYKDSDSNVLNLDMDGIQVELRTISDDLLVNGKELAVGDVYSFTKFWNLNPWTVYKVEFTNYGRVQACQEKMPAGIVIIGTIGNRVSIPKLVSVFVILEVLVFARAYYA